MVDAAGGFGAILGDFDMLKKSGKKFRNSKKGNGDPKALRPQAGTVVVPTEKIRSNGQTLKYKKFHLNIRKKYCCRGDHTLAQVFQSGYGVSICGGIQKVTEQPTLTDPALSKGWGGLGLDDHERSLPVLTTL